MRLRFLVGIFLFTFISSFLLISPRLHPVLAATTVRDFRLSASNPMIDTKININAGDSVTVRTSGSGSAIYPPGRTIPWVSTPGDPGCYASPAYLLPGYNCWSLIGRIGTSVPFHIGFERTLTATTRGRLYLAINHEEPLTGGGDWSVRAIVNHAPPPPVPTPFLNLPWDYQADGLSFDRVALAINSYFDHEYPLLSSGLGEPNDASGVVSYDGLKTPEHLYSSHDGYDYGIPAEVRWGDWVLAAADGCAIYRWSDAGGHSIRIDHANYYQTRYLHLLNKETLVTTSETDCIPVNQGQPIGRVGSTGTNTTGPHIHFMVVEDKNHDGDFEDNIPDGVTDPFGWQSEAADPWPAYTFTYAGQTRTGNKSFYLFTQPIPNLEKDLPTNGGFFELGQFDVKFPSGASNKSLVVNSWLSPIAKLSENIESVGSTITIIANDLFGRVIDTFQKPFTLTVNYSQAQLDRFNTETLTIYSSSDGHIWMPELTSLDSVTKTASAQISHLSYFALVAERKDTQPPQTIVNLSGDQGADNWYRSAVTAALTSQDNPDGPGVDYTQYRLNQSEWTYYTVPLVLTTEAVYQIEFFSVDKDGNQEDTQTVEFKIDKTPPTTTHVISQDSGGNNYFSSDVTLTLSAGDTANGSGVQKTLYRENAHDWQTYTQPTVFTNEGNHTIEFYSVDQAGNAETVQALSFVIDRGPPEAQVTYDPLTKDLSFLGLDASATTVNVSSPALNRKRVVISDVVGNTITLSLKHWTFGSIKSNTFASIAYNDQPPMISELNVLNIVHLNNTRTGATTYLTQTWLVKNEALLNILYQSKNNLSFIAKKTPGSKWQKTTQTGLILVKLTTDKGKIRYSY